MGHHPPVHSLAFRAGKARGTTEVYSQLLVVSDAHQAFFKIVFYSAE